MMKLTKNTNLIKRGKEPVKRTINLMDVGVDHIDPKKAIPSIFLILILATLFSKFFVYDKLMELAQAEEEVITMQSQLQLLTKQINDFGSIADEYGHYTLEGMSPEELTMVNRDDLVAMLERDVMKEAKIQSWVLSGNQLELNFSDYTLKLINQIVQKLQKEEIVDFCTVSTAETNQPEPTIENIRNADGTITQIRVPKQNYDKVYATILVYLKPVEQIGTEDE